MCSVLGVNRKKKWYFRRLSKVNKKAVYITEDKNIY